MPEFLLKISPDYEHGDEYSFTVKIAIKAGESIMDLQYGITSRA